MNRFIALLIVWSLCLAVWAQEGGSAGGAYADSLMRTRREKEVLHWLAQGLNSVEIGEKIFISPLTVESHRRNLLQKFKVTNVAALIHNAMEMKYI